MSILPMRDTYQVKAEEEQQQQEGAGILEDIDMKDIPNDVEGTTRKPTPEMLMVMDAMDTLRDKIPAIDEIMKELESLNGGPFFERVEEVAKPTTAPEVEGPKVDTIEIDMETLEVHTPGIVPEMSTEEPKIDAQEVRTPGIFEPIKVDVSTEGPKAEEVSADTPVEPKTADPSINPMGAALEAIDKMVGIKDSEIAQVMDDLSQVAMKGAEGIKGGDTPADVTINEFEFEPGDTPADVTINEFEFEPGDTVIHENPELAAQQFEGSVFLPENLGDLGSLAQGGMFSLNEILTELGDNAPLGGENVCTGFKLEGDEPAQEDTGPVLTTPPAMG